VTRAPRPDADQAGHEAEAALARARVLADAIAWARKG
jgi:hypothetical protein